MLKVFVAVGDKPADDHEFEDVTGLTVTTARHVYYVKADADGRLTIDAMASQDEPQGVRYTVPPK